MLGDIKDETDITEEIDIQKQSENTIIVK